MRKLHIWVWNSLFKISKFVKRNRNRTLNNLKTCKVDYQWLSAFLWDMCEFLNKSILKMQIFGFISTMHKNVSTHSHGLNWFMLLDELLTTLKMGWKTANDFKHFLFQETNWNVLACKCYAEFWAHWLNWFVVITWWSMTNGWTLSLQETTEKCFCFIANGHEYHNVLRLCKRTVHICGFSYFSLAKGAMVSDVQSLQQVL